LILIRKIPRNEGVGFGTDTILNSNFFEEVR